MKKILINILLFVPIISFSQDWNIPEIEWDRKTGSINEYVDLLKLDDRNALIIRFGYSSYWSNGQMSDFIVYQNNAKVFKYLVYQPNSNRLKTKVKRKKISKKDYKHYWDFLYDCIKDNKYKIDETRLNITEKKGKEEGTLEMLTINDGTNYHFEMYWNNNYISYESYEPTSYIKQDYPGSEERQKLVDLMNGFKKLIETY